MAQQPRVFALPDGRRSSAKASADATKSMTRKSDKVCDQALEVGWVGDSGWKYLCTKYVIMPTKNMMSINGDTSGSRIWKMMMLGSATQPSTPLRANRAAVLPHRLQNAERPAEALAHEAARVGRGFSEGERPVFVITR